MLYQHHAQAYLHHQSLHLLSSINSLSQPLQMQSSMAFFNYQQFLAKWPLAQWYAQYSSKFNFLKLVSSRGGEGKFFSFFMATLHDVASQLLWSPYTMDSEDIYPCSSYHNSCNLPYLHSFFSLHSFSSHSICSILSYCNIHLLHNLFMNLSSKLFHWHKIYFRNGVEKRIVNENSLHICCSCYLCFNSKHLEHRLINSLYIIL